MYSPPYHIARPFIAIPWGAAAGDQPVQFCLIARSPEKDAGLTLVSLHRFSYGTSYLAALVDKAGQVIEWFECWIQATTGTEDTPAARCGVLNNAELDQAWDNAVAAMREQPGSATLITGWEDRSSEALAVDPGKGVVTPWIHTATRQPWILCRDDAVLTAAGKAPYSSSLERWFQVKPPTGEAAWLEQSGFRDGAASASGLAQPESGDAASALIPLNPSGGKIAVWRFCPLSLERFSEVLRTKSAHSPSPVASGGVSGNRDSFFDLETQVLQKIFQSDRPSVFPTSPALESLYLRLALWHSAVEAVLNASLALRRPFFNVASDSFRVDLLPTGSLMPQAWSFRTLLVKPSQAIPFLETGTGTTFVPAAEILQSTAAARFGGARDGQGTVRLSQVLDAGEGQVKLEGFLDAAPLRDLTDSTLVWIQVALEGQSLTFVATLEPDQAGARAGTRFKAVSKQITPAALRQMKAALSMRRTCQYSLLQSVSPALDVYALGLVGLRILLAQDAHTLTELEDDIFEIAALLPRDSEISHLRYLAESADVNERLRRLMHPHDWNAAAEGGDAIPLEIWHAVIHELMEFVAVEEEHQTEPEFESYEPTWLQALAQRERGLRSLALHVRGVLSAPQVAHEEISRLVLRFVSDR